MPSRPATTSVRRPTPTSSLSVRSAAAWKSAWRERLAQADVPADELLDFVCRRRAEIVFDPGWLEVRFPFDEVSVELRRAAIDLDPDWLPWLGVVVRFVYG